MLIAEAAVFYTKLTRWEHHFDNLPCCAAPALLYYALGLRLLSADQPNAVVVDIGDTLAVKLEAVACYETQFGHRPEILERIGAANRHQGLAAGFSAGEVLFSPAPLGTRDLIGLLFGGKS